MLVLWGAACQYCLAVVRLHVEVGTLGWQYLCWLRGWASLVVGQHNVYVIVFERLLLC